MSSWQTEDPRKDSLKERAQKRVDHVRRVDDRTWVVQGNEDLGDAQSKYTVARNGDGWDCTCYHSPYGDSRRRTGCSHVAAVKLWLKGHRKPQNKQGGGDKGNPLPDTVKPAQGKPRAKDSDVWPYDTPRDLGLPFDEWRPQQVEILEKLVGCDKPYILLDAPTGSGKSLVAVAYARHLQQDAYYITFTKQLQNQLMEDYEGLQKTALLKGRSNYPTANHPGKFPEVTCADCNSIEEKPCTLCSAYGSDGRPIYGSASGRCPYQKAKRRLLSSKLGILNAALYLTECNFVGQLSGECPLAILDEGDLAEQQIMQFRELRISRWHIRKFGLSPPEYKTKPECWKEWAEELAADLDRRDTKDLTIASQKRVEQLIQKLRWFAGHIDEGAWVNCSGRNDWREDGPWVWKPSYISPYAEADLWSHADRWLVMSASILSPAHFAQDMGLDQRDIAYFEMDSTFPAERRPVKYWPVAELTYKNKHQAIPRILNALEKVAREHAGEKMLVHTVSYWLTQQVVKRLRRKGIKVFTYQSSSEREDALSDFRDYEDSAALVACSMERGVDLPHEQCDVIVVAKVPFLSLGDPQVNHRLHATSSGQSWYTIQAIRQLIQSTGRGMRSQDDRCTTYILDASFGRLLRENSSVWPDWWRDSLHRIRDLE